MAPWAELKAFVKASCQMLILFSKLSFVFVVLCGGSIRVFVTWVNTAYGGGAWKFEVTEMIGEGCVKYMFTEKKYKKRKEKK